MADAKIKKFKGNVTKLNYFHAYIINMSFYFESFTKIEISRAPQGVVLVY